MSPITSFLDSDLNNFTCCFCNNTGVIRFTLATLRYGWMADARGVIVMVIQEIVILWLGSVSAVVITARDSTVSDVKMDGMEMPLPKYAQVIDVGCYFYIFPAHQNKLRWGTIIDVIWNYFNMCSLGETHLHIYHIRSGIILMTL